MAEQNNDYKRFSELLPFYVNGTLDGADKVWIDTYIAEHPQSCNEVHFVELIREASISRHMEMVSKVPESVRLEKLLNKIRHSRQKPSLLEKLHDWLQVPIRIATQVISIPAPALAVVALLVIGQTVVIGNLMSTESAQETYRGGQADCVSSPRIRVVFKPDAKHVEIVLLLRKLEAVVQDGPSETGELWLSVPKGHSLEEVQAMLRSSALVDEAIVTKESRPAPGCSK